MRKILSFILLLAMSLPVMADNAGDARKTLDKVAALVSNKGGAQASFSISGAGIPKQNGTISVKGKKFCAHTPSATVWYDGKTQWTYLKANNEVNVANASAGKQHVMNPYSFINMYKSGYKLSMTTTAKTKTIHMKATGRQAIREMYITIDRTNTPTQVKMNQGKGWTVISITKFARKNISDKAFVFNSKDYPTAEVIDMR